MSDTSIISGGSGSGLPSGVEGDGGSPGGLIVAGTVAAHNLQIDAGALNSYDADGNQIAGINPSGLVFGNTLQTNGRLNLANGFIPSAPTSLTASLSNSQAQINELVAMLVFWGVVTDDRPA